MCFFYYIGLAIIIIIILYIFNWFNSKQKIPNIFDNQTDKIQINNNDENWTFCFNVLKDVSRSFNVVIQQLDTEDKNIICIFYLVLRGLDTIEDDMSIPIDQKKQMLISFSNDIENDKFTLDCGDKPEYKNLMNNFNKVSKCYKQLKPCYQAIIKNITDKMANGMIEFLEKKELVTLQEYDLYCHYVAGLVGIGLSEIFMQSGNELKDLSQINELSNSMGLFLQKTNIIRDIKEDVDDARCWWPSNIVKTYVDNNQDLLKEENEQKALDCLNELIINAMSHIPQCIEYLSNINDHKHFRFCVIPQVVAIQTLASLFNNKNVFKQTEKLNKMILARIFMNVNDLDSALTFYIDALEKIEGKINRERMSEANLQELERVKSFLVKYVIERSNKPCSRGLLEKNWMSNILTPLNSLF
jgi:farnesyl-diphosphate farnesyltransferase